jgi:hypothetical protein
MSVVVTAAATLAAAAGAADLGDDGFQVAQRDGVVVFNRLVGSEFRLMIDRPGPSPAEPLPVAPGRTSFDVEVARDPRRRLVVAFARCGAGGSEGSGFVPRGRCRLGVVRADGRGGEQRLGPDARPGVSHRAPALQGGRLAYVRLRRGRAEVVADGRVVLRRGDVSAVYGLDLTRSGLAVAIEQFDGYSARRSIVLLPTRGRPRVVARSGSGEANDPYLLSPSFSGRHLYWGYANHGAYVRTRRSFVFRRHLGTGRTTGTRLSPYVSSVAADAGRPATPLVVATDDALDSPEQTRGTQTVRSLTAPAFRPVDSGELTYG